jgi:serine/threonine-protein kinase
MIGTTLGHFRIDERLGAGGMGEVYRAFDLRLHRDVALKLIHPDLAGDAESRRRFEREARALAALDHPNVGAVYGVEEADGRLFMVLALVRGRSLEALAADGPLAAERARPILARVAEGLHAAHARGIVHRDMKSSNVMVGENDVPKIVDFGIALAPADTRLTHTGALVGTVGFTAPEVFGGAAADARSDLFALGVVAYQVLTGRLPFPDANPMATMHAIINQPAPPFPASLPPETRALEPIVRKCLEKRPENRFPDAHALAAALAGGAAAAAAPKPKSDGARRMALRILLVIALLELGAIGAGVVFKQRRAPDHGNAARHASEIQSSAVAVTEFENLTGRADLDWMKRAVPELLAAALMQSATLNVYDAQRLAELASANPAERGLPSGSTELLSRHGISRAITGSIIRSNDRLRLQGKLIEVPSGRVIRAVATEGAANGDLFALVSRLIPDLQAALEVNLSGNREAEAWLREITTSSTDSYRLYLQGHEALLAAKWVESAKYLEQAVAQDSNFVGAWADLTGAYWNIGDAAGLARARAKMNRLRDRADVRGRMRIDQMEAIVKDDGEEIIRTSSALIAYYPENRFYRYLLGRGYHVSGRHRECLVALAPLVAQRYEWPWTYMLAAKSYESLGEPDSAEAALKLGLEVTHDNPELMLEYANLRGKRGDQAGKQSALERGLASVAIVQTPAWRGRILLEMAKLHAKSGERDRARDELNRAITLLPASEPEGREARELLKSLDAQR